MLQFSITHKEVHHDLLMDHEEAVSVGAVEREDVVGVIRIGEVVEEDEVDETDTRGTETEIGTEMIVDHQEVLVVIEIGTAIVVDVGSCNLACRCIIIDPMLNMLCLFSSNLFAVHPISTFPTSFLYDFNVINSHAFVHALTHIVHA
jgi:hypothetical protein